MFRKSFVLPILFVYFFSLLVQVRGGSAQSLEWFRTYGGPDNDVGYWVEVTYDSGYIVAGRDRASFLIKTNDSGDVMWTSEYLRTGLCVQQTSDFGYIVATDDRLVKTNDSGRIIWKQRLNPYRVRKTYDSGYIILQNVDSPIKLIKTDCAGETLWTRTYTCAGNPYSVGESVEQTTDSGYVIAGLTGSSQDPSTYDVCLIKTDSAGNYMWDTTYGGALEDVAYSVQQTLDGGYIVAGYTYSYNNKPEVYLIRTDSAGDSLWVRTYGSEGLDGAHSVQQTYDSGYIVCGYSNLLDDKEMDLYLVKTDAAGDTIWTRAFGGLYEEWGYSVQQTPDSGYVAVGKSDSYYSGDVRDCDVYLIKVTHYQRGDANRDGLIDIQDIEYVIRYLFKTGPPPQPLGAGDAFYDHEVNIADVVYLINYVFSGGPAPS